MENKKARATPKRMRYIGSMLDAYRLRSGDDFEELPVRYVIMFASFSDARKKVHDDKAIQEFVMMDSKTKELLGDGTHVVKVDLNYNASDEIGKAIQDFSRSDWAEMECDWMARRTEEVKNTEEGQMNVEALLDEWTEIRTEELEGELREERDQRRKAQNSLAHGIVKLLRNTDLSEEEIATSFLQPVEWVRELAAKHGLRQG